jgi:spore coat protein H
MGRALALTAAILIAGAARTAEPSGGEDGQGVFDPAPVLRLSIEVQEEAVNQLRMSPHSFVSAVVHEGDRVYREVGLHLKGSIGSFRPFDDKPGITLKFNKFQHKQRFHGLKKLILNNSVQDSSYLSELIGNELFRAAGVPAQRAGFATVTMNGRKLGLYVVMEAVTKDFLARWFKDTHGNLYEGPGEVNSERLDVDSHHGVSDRLDVRELAEAAREPSSPRRMERLSKILDLDRFISFLAMEALTCHWDGYTTGKNNYHLYHDPSSGRFVFIPHGADQLFQNSGAPINMQANGLVARAVLKTAAGRRRFRERLKELTETVFKVEAIQKRIKALEAKIRPFLHEGGFGALFGHAATIQGFTVRIADRARSVREQLTGKVTIAAGRPLPFDAEGRAHLSGWQPRILGGRPDFQRLGGEGEHGGQALRVEIGNGGECRACWRRRVNLPPGHYRFLARVKLEGVEPVKNLAIPDTGQSGVDVRLSGDQPRAKLLGSRGWTTSEFDFDLEPEEAWEGEQPNTQVDLLCELQASAGVAWFDEDSLELRRTPPQKPE